MKQAICLLLLICLSMVFTITAPAHSSEARTGKGTKSPDATMQQRLTTSQVRTVEGIIQHVTDDAIQVRGKYYNVLGTPLKNPSGESLKKEFLTIGKKVEIFFQEDRITLILIYDDMAE
ncbi:MAG: hypothetical protein HZA14_03310 [Nitrospirae bacterium]|nr:hypothetical protein [Nitrospirota bacterium]